TPTSIAVRELVRDLGHYGRDSARQRKHVVTLRFVLPGLPYSRIPADIVEDRPRPGGKRDVLPTTNLVDCRNTLGTRVDLPFPEDFPRVLVIDVQSAIAERATDEQPAGADDQSISRGVVTAGVFDAFRRQRWHRPE